MTRENTSRNNRDDNRDSKKEVLLPDGRKLIRRPTENLGQQGLKLSAPKKEGFERRWVSDATDYKVQYMIDLGYTPAVDENGKQYEPRRGGNRVDGKSFDMFLMEIPTIELERLKQKHKELDPAAQALENQQKWIEGHKEAGLETYAVQSDGKTYNKVKEVDFK